MNANSSKFRDFSINELLENPIQPSMHLEFGSFLLYAPFLLLLGGWPYFENYGINNNPPADVSFMDGSRSVCVLFPRDFYFQLFPEDQAGIPDQQCSRTGRSIAEIHNRFHQNGSKRAQITLNSVREALESDLDTYFAR